MAALSGISERFKGRGCELHLSGEGLVLTRPGERRGEAQVEAATYAEVRGVTWDQRGRTLTVELAGERAAWVLAGMYRPEGAWAAALIEEGAQRTALRQGAGFSAPLSGEALGEVVARLAALEPPPAGVMADLLLTQAVLQRATDLHLQPGPEQARVRLRIDGSLRTVVALPAELGQRVVARMKVQGRMKVFQHGVAQTGGAALTVGGRSVDLRLTVLPTRHGEKLTVRVFDPGQALLHLEALGMEPEVLAALRECLEQPQGTILLTGPAGSGKTTTMYAALDYLRQRDPDRALATVEEPVELSLVGMDQTEVNRAVGLDFAEALRNVLRQDPQVIMVGEIRDAETAHIAVQAGLTGHLVLSTVHAPSTAGVFARLTQIGVEPYLVASSVTAVLAQRLVRQVCPRCGGPVGISREETEAAGLTAEELAGAQAQAGRGCEECGGTGYRGRTGLFALLPVSRPMREAVLACRPLVELEELAAREGIGDLWRAGVEKVRAGITTVAELRRVLGRRAPG